MPEESPKKDDSKSDLSQKLTDALIKLLVTGSGGSALYFLYINELPKAAIAGIIAIGTGLLTSFGEGLMKPLKEGMSSRGERLGKGINQSLDKAIDMTWGNMSGLERQYLEALKVHCHALKIEGFTGSLLPALALEEVFVPLRLITDSSQRSSINLKKEIWDLLPSAGSHAASFQSSQYRCIAIIAHPGFGKTTLTRHLTLSYANGSFQTHNVQALLPVLLLLGTIYPQIQSNEKLTLPALIIDQVKRLPRCQELEPSSQWFKERLEQGRCLVILDGLDEVPDAQREKVSRWLNWQMQNYPSVFILASRPHGYDSSLFEGVQPVQIQPFNREEKSDFIHKWYRARMQENWDEHWRRNQAQPSAKRLQREQVEAQSEDEAAKAAIDLINQLAQNPALNAIAENPLLVTIVAALHEAFESLPNQRSKFYQKIFNLLLEDRPKRRETKLTLPTADDNQAVLQVLALKLVQTNTTQFTQKQGTEWIREKLVRLNADSKLTPKKFLWEIQHIAGLLAGGESDLYQFSHKTFQEYLAAVALKDQESRIIEQLHNPNWEEVVCFFAALTNATGLVTAALASPPDQCDRALKLAHRMVVEEKSKLDPDIRQQLEQALAEAHLVGELGAKVRLEQRFRNLIHIDEQTAIDSSHITWDAYNQFISDQLDRKFHSQADPKLMPQFLPQTGEPSYVTGISWQDAQWFCAWLTTQPELQAEDGVYDYRLPTPDEIRQFPVKDAAAYAYKTGMNLIPFSNSPDSAGNVVRVVRVKRPDRYQALVNYLANGRWQGADWETDRVMLEVAERTEQGYLDFDDIENFPCDDLQTIDQLWVKFSGGRFGFSVQRQIWLEVGGKLDFGKDTNAAREAYQRLGDRVGWHKDGDGMRYNNLIFDLNASAGAFPSVGWGYGRGIGLFSRAEICRV